MRFDGSIDGLMGKLMGQWVVVLMAGWMEARMDGWMD